jgi:hypothetical protein
MLTKHIPIIDDFKRATSTVKAEVLTLYKKNCGDSDDQVGCNTVEQSIKIFFSFKSYVVLFSLGSFMHCAQITIFFIF